ncbi:MAG: ABC transporter ATP-binding protein [Solirubrobacteraceae bacterium]
MLLRPYRQKMRLLCGVSVALAALPAVQPLLYRDIVNAIIAKDAVARIWMIVAALIFLTALWCGFQMFAAWLTASLTEGIVYDTRTRLFGHVMRMPLNFFLHARTGALTARVQSDVLSAPGAVAELISTSIGTIFGLSFLLVAMATVSWQLSLLALFGVLPCLGLSRLIKQRMIPVNQQTYQVQASMASSLIECFSVSGAIVARLFGGAVEEERFATKAETLRRLSVTNSLYSGAMANGLQLSGCVVLGLVYGFGGAMALHQDISVGTVVAMAAYTTQLVASFSAVPQVMSALIGMSVSFDRVFELIDIATAEVSNARPHLRVDPPLALAFDEVTFWYPTELHSMLGSLGNPASPYAEVRGSDSPRPDPVVNSLSFHVGPGEWLAIVGKSGTGKTTIAHLAAGLLDAQHGTVRLGGLDIGTIAEETIRWRVGLASQDTHLLHDTLRANLLYAKPDAAEDDIYGVLEDVGLLPTILELPGRLDTEVGERGARFSGGQRQRIAIARLLLRRPAVVLLDEATAHLDGPGESAVCTAIRRRLPGSAVLVIAHRLAVAARADRIIVLEEGGTVESGTHDALYAKGTVYAQLWDAQASKWSAQGHASVHG